VENAGSQSGIGFPCGEHIHKMLHISSSARGNDRDFQHIGHFGKFGIGKSVFGSVVIHAGEKDFARATVFGFFGPTEQFFFGGNAASVNSNCPT
jgi:hypothetical protein